MTAGAPLQPQGRPVRRAVLLAAGALLGCTPGADLARLPEAAPGPYRLGPEDVVRVTVFEEARLSGQFRISDTGTLALPLLGTLRAAGLTTEELQAQLDAEMRRRGLLEQPRTAVEIASYRPVFVLGEVVRAGQFPWQPGLTVLGAVALAGGFSPRAVQGRVSVQRARPGTAPREYAATRDAALEPGDVVTVLERRF